MLWAPWWLWLSLRLDAEAMDTTPDDLLSAVAVLHAPDLYEAARDGSPTLTLDVLHRVAWALGMDLHVNIVPREATP
jgi:hypothetical protein